MKKLIITLLLVLSTLSGWSQNFIGYSLKDIWNHFDSRGYILTKGWTEDNNTGYFYFSASDKDRTTIYYFNEANVCFMCSIIFYDMTKSEIKEVLNSLGYRQVSGDEYVSKDWRCTIMWLDDYNLYSIIILPRIQEQYYNQN